MPYNNNPIAPSDEVTGTTSLPLARVKKIIAADPDTGACSNNAAFAIAVASQLFVQHLVEQTHNVVKSERKPRRNIQYKDVANAVSRIDNLEFLADVVPRTTTFGKFKERKARGELGKNDESLTNGQRTLEQMDRGDFHDREMLDVDHEGGATAAAAAAAAAVDGIASSQEEVTQSPNSSRVGRHNFDAVRNGYYDPAQPVPMEE